MRKWPLLAVGFAAVHAVVHVTLPVVDLFFHMGMILPLIFGASKHV